MIVVLGPPPPSLLYEHVVSLATYLLVQEIYNELLGAGQGACVRMTTHDGIISDWLALGVWSRS